MPVSLAELFPEVALKYINVSSGKYQRPLQTSLSLKTVDFLQCVPIVSRFTVMDSTSVSRNKTAVYKRYQSVHAPGITVVGSITLIN